MVIIIPFYPKNNMLVLVGCPKIPKVGVGLPCFQALLRKNPLTYSWMVVLSDTLFCHLFTLDIDWRKFHWEGVKP
jgi:hypothetical protein